jgi:hypothetical protein
MTARRRSRDTIVSAEPVKRCPCGNALDPMAAADMARGICSTCRDGKKKRRSKPTPDFVDVPIPGFDVEPEPRRLVPLPDWPDYRAAGLT